MKDSNKLRDLLIAFKIEYKTVINNDDTLTIKCKSGHDKNTTIDFHFGQDREFIKMGEWE